MRGKTMAQRVNAMTACQSSPVLGEVEDLLSRAAQNRTVPLLIRESQGESKNGALDFEERRLPMRTRRFTLPQALRGEGRVGGFLATSIARAFGYTQTLRLFLSHSPTEAAIPN